MKNRRAVFKVAVPRAGMMNAHISQLRKIDKFVENAFAQAPFDTLIRWYDAEKFVCEGTASVEITKAAVTVIAELAKGNLTEALMMIDIYKDRQVSNAHRDLEHE